jgi:hypothetical protein
MTEHELGEDRLPAIGHPGQGPEEGAPQDEATRQDEQPDFAGEHADTAVDKAVETGEDGEEESPEGWAGLEE